MREHPRIRVPGNEETGVNWGGSILMPTLTGKSCPSFNKVKKEPHAPQQVIHTALQPADTMPLPSD